MLLTPSRWYELYGKHYCYILLLIAICRLLYSAKGTGRQTEIRESPYSLVQLLDVSFPTNSDITGKHNVRLTGSTGRYRHSEGTE